MRKFTTPRLRFAIIIPLAAIALLIIFEACRKTDKDFGKEKEPVEVKANRFFDQHTTTDPTIKAAMGFVKRENDKKGFVEKTVTQIGFPYWNKAMVVRSKKQRINSGSGTAVNRNATSSSSNDSSIVIYVPFVRDSQNYVNASMVIRFNQNDSSLNYLCDWQYKNLEHGSQTTEKTAESYALFFMILDNRTLGHTKFNITDVSLFPNTTPRIGGGKKLGFVNIATANPSTDQPNLAEYQEICVDFYVCGDALYCGESCDYLNCAAAPGQEGHCYLVQEICDGWWQDDGGGNSSAGDTGGPSTGGGSGGSGGGSTPPECNSPTTNGRNRLCTETPGWEPEIVDPVTPPAVLTSVDLSGVENPCLQVLIQQIGAFGHQSFILKTYNKEQYTPATQDRYKIKYVEVNGLLGNQGQQVPAKTINTVLPDGTHQVQITINQNFLQHTSKEWVTSVLLHEMLHGILTVMLPANLGGTEELQHKYMFDEKWPLGIWQSLHELFPNLPEHDGIALGMGGMKDAYMIHSDPNDSSSPMIIDPVKNQFAQTNYFWQISGAEQMAYNYSQGALGTPFC